MTLNGRRVAVWRWRWLPGGETFVRNHVTSLRRWEAVPFGAKRVDSPLAAPDDVILFGPRERLTRGLFDVTGWSPRVRRFLADGDFDLVHAHFGLDAVVIALICRRLGGLSHQYLLPVVILEIEVVIRSVARSMSSAVVQRPRDSRTADRLRSAGRPIAVSTGEGW